MGTKGVETKIFTIFIQIITQSYRYLNIKLEDINFV